MWRQQQRDNDKYETSMTTKNLISASIISSRNSVFTQRCLVSKFQQHNDDAGDDNQLQRINGQSL